MMSIQQKNVVYLLDVNPTEENLDDSKEFIKSGKSNNRRYNGKRKLTNVDLQNTMPKN